MGPLKKPSDRQEDHSDVCKQHEYVFWMWRLHAAQAESAGHARSVGECAGTSRRHNNCRDGHTSLWCFGYKLPETPESVGVRVIRSTVLLTLSSVQTGLRDIHVRRGRVAHFSLEHASASLGRIRTTNSPQIQK